LFPFIVFNPELFSGFVSLKKGEKEKRFFGFYGGVVGQTKLGLFLACTT